MEVFAEQGPIGLAIWAALMLVGLLNARWLTKVAKGRQQLLWATDLGRMSQAFLVAYFVGGAFLSLGYWIQTFILLVVLSGARRLITAELRQDEKAKAADARKPVPAITSVRPVAKPITGHIEGARP